MGIIYVFNRVRCGVEAVLSLAHQVQFRIVGVWRRRVRLFLLKTEGVFLSAQGTSPSRYFP